jgi:putative PIN family toxin of toxin-antitoxin system
MPERVVIDTNVWLSGLLWRGKPYQCLLLARSKIVQAVYCQSMAAELSSKLRDVFKFSEDHIRAVMYDLRRTAEPVEIAGTLHVVPNDPDDDMFVECAIVGKAAFIISEDHHLLSLGEYEGIRILSSAQAVAVLASTQ